MTDLIDFIFSCLVSVWGLVTSNWILSMSFLLGILGLIIGLINASRQDA